MSKRDHLNSYLDSPHSFRQFGIWMSSSYWMPSSPGIYCKPSNCHRPKISLNDWGMFLVWQATKWTSQMHVVRLLQQICSCDACVSGLDRVLKLINVKVVWYPVRYPVWYPVKYCTSKNCHTNSTLKPKWRKSWKSWAGGGKRFRAGTGVA